MLQWADWAVYRELRAGCLQPSADTTLNMYQRAGPKTCSGLLGARLRRDLLQRQRGYVGAHGEVLHHGLGREVEVAQRVQPGGQRGHERARLRAHALLLVLRRAARLGGHKLLRIQLAQALRASASAWM